MQNRLKDLREDNDLTQADVGKILNITQSEYGRYERGLHMMGIDKYIKLAEYYNISIDYLVGLIPTPKPLNEKMKAKKVKTKLKKLRKTKKKNSTTHFAKQHPKYKKV